MSNMSLEETIVESLSAGLEDKAVSIYQLPYEKTEIFETLLKLRKSDELSRVKMVKLQSLMINFIVLLGEGLSNEDDMNASLSLIMKEDEDEQQLLLSWFLSGVVLRNRILPIESFVALTANSEDSKSPLSNLRKEFWNSHNGSVLREKYYNVWLSTSEEGRNASQMPGDYAYRIWFSLVIPEELKQDMPENFKDARLSSA